MSANKNRKRKRVNNCNITQVIKNVVAAELGVKVTDVNNHTDLDYFAAMNTTFDLQHRYPDISFPEDKFDKYCRVGTLRNYVVSRLTKVK